MYMYMYMYIEIEFSRCIYVGFGVRGLGVKLRVQGRGSWAYGGVFRVEGVRASGV